jgi:SWI/SNF-related matrix-associated actin-dependent regulator of chromatin subfamily A3
VFSYWTFTLDLIEILLKDASISFTRIDGKQSGDQRDEAILKFETDKSIQVILVSITCGGTGYGSWHIHHKEITLTNQQTRSYRRLHRMGQTKEVRTVRFRIKNSFEEVCPLFPPPNPHFPYSSLR